MEDVETFSTREASCLGVSNSEGRPMVEDIDSEARVGWRMKEDEVEVER